MANDGGLRGIFRKQFPTFQWSSIETAGSASGVPDSEFCTPTGISGWIEYKQTKIFHVQIKPLQVAWIDRRARYGGNVWIAVRRKPIADIWQGVDELWIMHGNQVRALFEHGLNGVYADCWEGGPSNWNWTEIGNKIKCFTP